MTFTRGEATIETDVLCIETGFFRAMCGLETINKHNHIYSLLARQVIRLPQGLLVFVH